MKRTRLGSNPVIRGNRPANKQPPLPLPWTYTINTHTHTHTHTHIYIYIQKSHPHWRLIILERPIAKFYTGKLSLFMVYESCGIKYITCIQGVPGGNVPDFGRLFLKLKYTDITQNTYIRSWTVTEIMAREVWKYDSCYTLIDYQIHIKTGRNMWSL